MRLNGWKRIGIVVSFASILAGSFWISGVITDHAASLTSMAMENCERQGRPIRDCWAGFGKTYEQMLGPEVRSLTPIGAGAVAKASKHVILTRGKPAVARADQVSVKSVGFGQGRFGDARWDGPPQVFITPTGDDPWVLKVSCRVH